MSDPGQRHRDYNIFESTLNQLLSYSSDPEVQKSFITPDSFARTFFSVVLGQHQRALPRRLLIGAETNHVGGSSYQECGE